MRLPLLFACAAALSTPAWSEPQFSISAPGTVLTGYVTGSAVPITVSSTDAIPRGSLQLTLNGVDVTSALHADGSGSMSGTVAGLQPGANVFKLLSKEHGKFGKGQDESSTSAAVAPTA